MEEQIVYVGNFSFPDGNAAGLRVQGNARLLQSLGYRVSVVGCGPLAPGESFDVRPRLEAGFPTWELPEAQRSVDWLRVRSAYQSYKAVIEHIENDGPVFAVVIYSCPTLSLLNSLIVRHCKRRGIRVVADVVDWLDVSTSSRLYNLVNKADDTYQKYVANTACDGVVCISSFFSNFYESKGLQTIVIPPLLSGISPDGPTQTTATVPTFIYAGNPFRLDARPDDTSAMKDRLDLVVALFAKLAEEGHEFELNIYGIQEQDFTGALPSITPALTRLGDSIRFHGRVPNAELRDLIRQASFSILLRDEKRETTAGFPTKVAESISLGTPVVVSAIGDLATHVEDGVTGLLLSQDPDEMLDQLRRAVVMPEQEVLEMKSASLASGAFSPETYATEMSAFLERL